MKKLFETPEVEVLRLRVQDRILGTDLQIGDLSSGDYAGEEDVLD